MQLLSREAELELLEKVGDHLAKRMELEKQRDDNWDLISRPDLLKKKASYHYVPHLKVVRKFITARVMFTIFLQ